MSNVAKAVARWLGNHWVPVLIGLVIGLVVGVSFGLVFLTEVVIDWPPCNRLPSRCPEF